MFPFPAVQEIFFPFQGTQNDPVVHLSIFFENSFKFTLEKAAGTWNWPITLWRQGQLCRIGNFF